MNGTAKNFTDMLDAHPAEPGDLGEFARRIASLTETMLASGQVDRFVAQDGLERLRADLVLKGARPDDVEPITRLLGRLSAEGPSLRDN